MAKVSPFNTKNPEHPRVFHDQSECRYGKEIDDANKEWGTGGKLKCEECKRLDT